jgi:hypothetical protein
VPPNVGTNAKHAKPQTTNSRSFRAGVLLAAYKNGVPSPFLLIY